MQNINHELTTLNKIFKVANSNCLALIVKRNLVSRLTMLQLLSLTK
jgi:hypothetical protein